MTDPQIPEIDPQLRDAISQLAGEQQPSRELWTDIRSRVDAERVHALPSSLDAKHGRRMIPLRVAAAAAAVLVIATASLTWRARTSEPLAPADSVRATLSFASYERSADELAHLLEQRSGSLDPATRIVVERSLRTIEDALTEARAALERDPASTEMRAFVEAAWRQKLDFLRRANDVAALRGL